VAQAQDVWDLYQSMFSMGEAQLSQQVQQQAPARTSFPQPQVVVQAQYADADVQQAVRTLDGEPDVIAGCLSCVPDVLSQSVRDLMADMQKIVDDDAMRRVNAPQGVVNQALAKSKELVCAEVEMFARAHKLNVDVGCHRVPQHIPPMHFQVIKFPGLAQKKRDLENEIESYRQRLRSNPQDFSADSLIRRKSRELQCLYEPDETYLCHEVHASAGQTVVQIEIQDRNGQWYEFKQMPVAYFSGLPGPKTRQGDYQVPEARFNLTDVNPGSKYFVNVHVDYENWSDRASLLGDLNRPVSNRGGDIKIHGNGGSVGCLDMGNRAAPWIAAAVDLNLKRGRTPKIDIYPTDMENGDLEEVASWPAYRRYERFWGELKDRYWSRHSVNVRRDLQRVDQMIAGD